MTLCTIRKPHLPGTELGVNESARDSACVIDGMFQGIFARVGEQKNSTNALATLPYPFSKPSSLWHPIRNLTKLLTLHKHAQLFDPVLTAPPPIDKPLPSLRPLTIAYIGDSTNVLHDMLVAYLRLGHKMRVASPPHPAYQCPEAVWDHVVELGRDKSIWWGSDPKEAVKGADAVVTDTWYEPILCWHPILMWQDIHGSRSRKSPAVERLCWVSGHKSSL